MLCVIFLQSLIVKANGLIENGNHTFVYFCIYLFVYLIFSTDTISSNGPVLTSKSLTIQTIHKLFGYGGENELDVWSPV